MTTILINQTSNSESLYDLAQFIEANSNILGKQLTNDLDYIFKQLDAEINNIEDNQNDLFTMVEEKENLLSGLMEEIEVLFDNSITYDESIEEAEKKSKLLINEYKFEPLDEYSFYDRYTINPNEIISKMEKMGYTFGSPEIIAPTQQTSAYDEIKDLYANEDTQEFKPKLTANELTIDNEIVSGYTYTTLNNANVFVYRTDGTMGNHWNLYDINNCKHVFIGRKTRKQIVKESSDYVSVKEESTVNEPIEEVEQEEVTTFKSDKSLHGYGVAVHIYDNRSINNTMTYFNHYGNESFTIRIHHNDYDKYWEVQDFIYSIMKEHGKQSNFWTILGNSLNDKYTLYNEVIQTA